MYEAFFELREKPFSLLPDPGFLFLSRQHQDALTLLEYGLMSQAGFIVLTGEIGSGKTTLMRYLLDRVDPETVVGLISQTHRSLGDLLDWVCFAFDIRAPGASKVERHQAFIDFIIERYAKGKRVLLIVDEAQNLGLDQLEELRLLSNINADKDLVLQIMLIGQPQLRDILADPVLEQFVQRIAASYDLGPLEPAQTERYIHHRIFIAGGHRRIFSKDACHAVHFYSRGIPRLINLICDSAMVSAYGAGEERVTGAAIDALVNQNAHHLLLPIAANTARRDAARVPLEAEGLEEDTEFLGWLREARPADSHPDALGPHGFSDGLELHSTPSDGWPAGGTWLPDDVGSPLESTDASFPEIATGLQIETKDSTLPETQPTGKRSHGSSAPLSPTAPDRGHDAIASGPGDDTPQRRRGAPLGWLIAVLLVVGLAGAWLLDPGLVERLGQSIQSATTKTHSPGLSPPSIEPTPPPSAPETEPVSPSPATAPLPSDAEIDPAPRALDETRSETDPTDHLVILAPAPISPPIETVDEPNAPDDQPPTERPDVETSGLIETVDEPTAPDEQSPTERADVETSVLDPTQTPTPEPTGSDPSHAPLTQLAERLDALRIEIDRTDDQRLLVNLGSAVQFGDGRSELAAEAQATLDRIADALKEIESLQIKVLGHTDHSGTLSVNEWLSERRAQAVEQYLIERGLDAGRLTHEGRGQREPRIDIQEEWRQGPWVNRRIELDIRAVPPEAD